MSTMPLPKLKYERRHNRNEASSQNLNNDRSTSKEQPQTSSETEEHFAVQEAKNLHEDDSMLEALDGLSDGELDELLSRTLALNKRLKEQLKDDSSSGHSDMARLRGQEKRIFDSSRVRNAVVLPPIVKKDCALPTRLRANR